MPAEFDVALVRRELGQTQFGERVRHFGVVGSTNQMALEAAAAGAEPAVWIADEQTAGRGRGGHAWHSAAGDGLYVSLLVRPRIALSLARSLPLATGLAAQAAVLEATGLALDLRWPNDLMFEDRKCGGILVESASQEGPSLGFAVIGIGINVNHASFPPDLRAVATSLHLESGRFFDREPLLAALIRNVDREVTQLQAAAEGAEIRKRFTAASSWVCDKRVRVGAEDAGSGGYTGWTRGLDRDGFLLVEDDAGVLRTVLSGGVRSA
jgi:BirA family biotin operon repressor/biotin-[acetyl-CoA-carboxylase] ligase